VMQETETIRGYHLMFWDLADGKMAGEILMQEKKDPWGQCGGITFSPDGKEMALIWRLMKDGVTGKIMRFDMEKGTKIGEDVLHDELKPSAPGFRAGGLRTFQFLPDGRGWLVSGLQVVDRETAAVVWEIDPKPKHGGDTHDRRFVDGYHVTDQKPGRDKTV